MKNTIFPKLTGLYKYLSILLIAFSMPAIAQVQQSTPSGETYNYTLQQVIDYALQHQSSVLNSKLDQNIADQRIRENLATGLPQLNGSAELDDYFAKPVTIIPGAALAAFSGKPGNYPDVAVSFLLQYQATVGVNASQMIFNGTFLQALKAAKTYASLSREQTKSNEIDVVANVTKAYYGVKINETNLTALDSSIALLQKSLDDTKAMNKQGFVEKLDVDRLSVTLSNLQSQRQNLRSAIDLYYYLLKFQMGMPVNATLTLVDKLPDTFPEPVIEPADYNKRIEFSIFNTTRSLDEANVKINKAGYLPSLSAIGSLSTNQYSSQFDLFDPGKHWYVTGLIGLKLNVPIFDGFMKDAKIKEANLSLMQNQNDIDNFKNLVDLQVKQASVTYESNYKILQSQKANLKLAEDVARVTKIKYVQGVGTNIEVTDAESQLIQAQNNYYNALYNMGVSHVDLQKAQGTLY